MNPDETCQSMCWVDEYDHDAYCSLPPGHEGQHWDKDEGWAW